MSCFLQQTKLMVVGLFGGGCFFLNNKNQYKHLAAHKPCFTCLAGFTQSSIDMLTCHLLSSTQAQSDK